MDRDGSIRYEFRVALPEEPLPPSGSKVWGHASGVLSGRADPGLAFRTFDPTGAQPFETTSSAIRDHVQGWISWAVVEVFRRTCGGGTLDAWAPTAEGAAEQVRAELASRLVGWGFQIEALDLGVEIPPECVEALPTPLRAQLSSAGPTRLVQHSFSGDIPPVQDPVSGKSIHMRCNASIEFAVNLEEAKPAVDPSGGMAEDRLVRATVTRAEEWFWYGLKQSFYNWICDSSRPHRRFVRDYQLIHPEVMALCQDGLAGIGVAVSKAQVRYEALDPDSAWALTAPGQSGRSPVVPGPSPTSPAAPQAPASTSPSSGKHRITPDAPSLRADSQQAMAATIAIMSLDDLPASVGAVGVQPSAGAPAPAVAAGGPPAPLPPIEEASWRHQKSVLREHPGLDRVALAPHVLARLKADGYPLDERRRIAGVIGGDPNLVTD